MNLIKKDTKIYPGDFIKYVSIKNQEKIGYGFFVKKILHEKYPETQSLFLFKNDNHYFKINICNYIIYHSPHTPRNNFKGIINMLSESIMD